MDATFGRNYDGSFLNTYAFENGLPFQHPLFLRPFQTNPKDFIKKFARRWNELKNDQLSCKVISERIDAYKELHLQSNASEREKTDGR